MTQNQPLILIIDDDSRNIFALKIMLKSRGYLSISATNAAEGIMLMQSHPNLRVVLLDIMMPEMDGYEAIAAIRKLPSFRQMALIAVTAQAMVGDKEKCIAAGADAYISKPVNIDILIDMLSHYL